MPLSLCSPVFPCWKQPCSSPAVAQALLGGCLQQPRPEQSRNLSLLRCLTHSCSQNEDQGLRRRNEREWTVSFGWVWVGFFFFLFSTCGGIFVTALPACCILPGMGIPALRKGWLEPAALPRVFTSHSQQIPGLLPLLQTRQELPNPSWEVSPCPPQGGEFYCQQKDSNPPNPNLEILPVSLK